MYTAEFHQNVFDMKYTFMYQKGFKFGAAVMSLGVHYTSNRDNPRTSSWTSVDRRGSYGAAIDFCIPPIYYNCQLNNLAFASPLNAQGSLPNTCFELMG